MRGTIITENTILSTDGQEYCIKNFSKKDKIGKIVVFEANMGEARIKGYVHEEEADAQGVGGFEHSELEKERMFKKGKIYGIIAILITIILDFFDFRQFSSQGIILNLLVYCVAVLFMYFAFENIGKALKHKEMLKNNASFIVSVAVATFILVVTILTQKVLASSVGIVFFIFFCGSVLIGIYRFIKLNQFLSQISKNQIFFIATILISLTNLVLVSLPYVGSRFFVTGIKIINFLLIYGKFIGYALIAVVVVYLISWILLNNKMHELKA